MSKHNDEDMVELILFETGYLIVTDEQLEQVKKAFIRTDMDFTLHRMKYKNAKIKATEHWNNMPINKEAQSPKENATKGAGQ